MKFKVKYIVNSIPCDKTNNIEQVFNFTYEAKTVGELADINYYINKYLQQYFTKDNYEITCIRQEV